jgi:hypothetical protein
MENRLKILMINLEMTKAKMEKMVKKKILRKSIGMYIDLQV